MKSTNSFLLHPNPEQTERLLQRLKRIEGQIRGLQRMVEENRPCIDILTQVASVHEALRGFNREMIRRYLENCMTNALRSGDPQEEERAYEELLDVLYKFLR